MMSHARFDERAEMLLAAKTGNVPKLKKLVASGVRINEVREPNGDSAIHNAARFGHYEATKFLIKKGANVNAANKFGGTPLHKGVRGGFDDIVQLLLKHGADPRILQHYGETALHQASRTGHLETVQNEVEKGVDLNAVNNFGDTALHRAAWNGHALVVEYLLGKNIDASIRNNDGDTAQDLASQRGYAAIVEQMRKFNDLRRDIQSAVAKISVLVDHKYNEIKTNRRQLDQLEVELTAKEIEAKDIEHQLANALKVVDKLRSQNTQIKNEIERINSEMSKTKEGISESEKALENVKNMTLKQEKRNHSQLEDDLTCPICMVIPLPPKKVFQCAEGHMFCDACKNNIEKCPECRADLSGILIRSRRVEEIIQKLFP